MTLFEMLDLLETGMAKLRTSRPKPDSEPPAIPMPLDAGALRERLESSGLSAADFAVLSGVPVVTVDRWIDGHVPIPPWVPLCLQMYGLLSATARRKILQTPKPAAPKAKTKTHPFSRIEEL